MNMDYSAMWAVVDAHRRCADELEQTLRELTGDRPAPEVDKVELYSKVIDALMYARIEMQYLADREGHTVRRTDAMRCRVHADRCNKVLDTVWKLGEL